MSNKKYGKKIGAEDNTSFSSVGRPIHKKKFKMPASLTIILGILFFVVALT
jgi:hypothetical protein